MNIYFERLKEFWESKGYKDATKFAHDLGYNRGENILRLARSENNEPGMMILGDIMKKFPDFDIYFLLTGEKKNNKYQLPAEKIESVNANIEFYSCPECWPRVKKIQDQEAEIAKLKDELLEVYRSQAKKETHSEDSASHGEDTKRIKAG